MVCKSIYIDAVDKACFEETFSLLSASRRERILAMQSEEEQRNAVAFEFLSRECLSELTDAPKFAFNILTGINKQCLVGNFSAYFSLSLADNFLCCAAERTPIGIDCRSIQPFSFMQAQKEMNEAEIHYIYGNTVRSFADIVRLDVCDVREEMERYWRVRTMKEAYFTALGRTFRNLRNISFDLTAATCDCSDSRFSFITTQLSKDNQYIFSVVNKSI